MRVSIVYKRLFAYSERSNKYFHTEFGSGTNIIYGKNTSGKSTLIESILYTFGINDEKQKLEEVLSEDVTFRLDLELSRGDASSSEEITIVRQDDVLVVRRVDVPLRKFIGIGGNRAAEHRELKEYWDSSFDFTLFLESSGEYKQASIEAFFLPYYVAQDVGWVYRNKSFRGLDFIKNFNEDYFDYYLGISNQYDREKKRSLELQKRDLEFRIAQLSSTKRNDTALAISTILDEKCVIESNEYLESYKEQKAELIRVEKDYLIESNKLSYLEIRKNLLAKIRREIVSQLPSKSKCPTCNQTLPGSTESIYQYYQDLNDTNKQLDEVKELLNEQKASKGKINSLAGQIDELRKKIAINYDLYSKYEVGNVSLGSWITNKVNVALGESLTQQIGELSVELDSVNASLKDFKTEDAVSQLRSAKSKQFSEYFVKSLTELGVKPFDDDRYTEIYSIPAFPRQGVELLKTLLGYTVSFCRMIATTPYVHRLPILLDAIFKEDIEEENRTEILKYIHNEIKQQLIVSVADSKKNLVSIEEYNSNYFNGNATIICIGENVRTRAFLSPYNNEYPELLRETLEMIESDV